MYPYSMPTDYRVNPFKPYPKNTDCKPCGILCQPRLAQQLSCLGFKNFGRLVTLSGLKNLDDRNITMFAVPDENIPEAFLKTCERMTAINIIRSSTMPNNIPTSVLSQSQNAFYASLNRQFNIHIYFENRRMIVDGINCIGGDLKDGKLTVHVLDMLINPPCSCN